MKNIVITGGSSGFGKALATEFYRRNCNVLICGRNISRLQKTKTDIGKDRVQIFQCDVGDYSQVNKLGKYADYLYKDIGGIDHWINGAAICEGPQPFNDLDLVDVEEVISTNLLGTIYGCKVAIANEAKNVYVISGHGSGGGRTDGFSVYGTSKAGVSQFASTLANETKTTNIHTIAPGIMKTPLTEKLFSDKSLDFITKTTLKLVAQDPRQVSKKIVPQILGIKGNGKVLRV
jgi:NAD(P)-dependent dehydrogenase (short-subunit alcohol dehydrogenase family)